MNFQNLGEKTRKMDEMNFKNVDFLFEVELSMLVEDLDYKGLCEEASDYYWWREKKPHSGEILDMKYVMESFEKDRQGVVLRITGHVEEK